MATIRSVLLVAVVVVAVTSAVTAETGLENKEALDARTYGYGAGNVDLRASDDAPAKDITVTEAETSEIDDDDNDDDDDTDGDDIDDDGAVNPTEQTPDNKTVQVNKDDVETRSDFQFGLDGIKNPIKVIGDFIKALPKLPKLSWSGNVGDDGEDETTADEKVDEEYDTGKKYETKKVDEAEDISDTTTFPTDSWKDRESKDYYKYWYNSD